MSALQILPILAYLGAGLVILWIALGRAPARMVSWGMPLGLGAVFALFSIVTVAQEGVVQFWINHSTTLAGNQVWFDLLIAVVLAFWLLAPRARAVGMPLLPWAVAVLLTACIALLPMLALVLWREGQAKAEGAR